MVKIRVQIKVKIRVKIRAKIRVQIRVNVRVQIRVKTSPPQAAKIFLGVPQITRVVKLIHLAGKVWFRQIKAK